MFLSSMQLALRRWQRSNFMFALLRDLRVVFAIVVLSFILLLALLASWITPQSPFDLQQINLMNANLPPLWLDGGQQPFILGTDEQGYDIYSSILFGLRTSLFIGFGAVAIQIILGTVVGVVSGYLGGRIDSFLMRLADIQLSFSTLMVAIIISALFKTLFGLEWYTQYAALMLMFVIGLSEWPQYARAVRSCVLAEKEKEYAQACRVMRYSPFHIMFWHILPNCISPLIVISTIQVANAIMSEAALSFLGLGMPPSIPSLGSLIHNGFDTIFSGSWWMTVFPGVVLIIITLTINLIGDWLRDFMDPNSLVHQYSPLRK